MSVPAHNQNCSGILDITLEELAAAGDDLTITVRLNTETPLVGDLELFLKIMKLAATVDDLIDTGSYSLGFTVTAGELADALSGGN